MKILFCCPCPPIRELGIGKHILELAHALRMEGCSCDIASPDDMQAESPATPGDYNGSLRAYLLRHAANYDVVDYDHNYLPFPRSEFPARPLFVARSFLLRHHFTRIRIPGRRLWRSRLRRWAYAWWLDPYREHARARDAQRTAEEADLVNVLNEDDRRTLIAAKIPAGKIATIGLGLTADSLAGLHRLSVEVPPRPLVVSVATFDARKGAVDLPDILEHIWRQVPDVRFRLLGGRRPVADVLSRFPARMRASLDVVPEYDQESLPGLLDGGSVGIFPSYIEGFGLAVLEMLAAAIPVVAYRAPGASTILPADCVVTRGDAGTLSRRVCAFLSEREPLSLARVAARRLSMDFTMESVARETKTLYAERVQAKKVVK